MTAKPWLPYVAPFALYLLLVSVRSSQNVVWTYPLTTVLVAATLWFFWRDYDELRSPLWNTRAERGSRGGAAVTWATAIGVGLAVIAIWVGLDPYYPQLGTTELFDPRGHAVFIGFRVVGAVFVVPLMEELFWRACALRWLIDEDFKRIPVGTFTWSSFAATTVLFGLEHHQWLPGLVCGALYNWLYYKHKDVSACVVAHAVSNAALAAWVLKTGAWQFW